MKLSNILKSAVYGGAAFSFAIMAVPQASKAAGFFIQEQSTSGLGASFAGEAAMPRNASILFYNPAGMTYLEDRQLNAGAHVIIPMADLDNTGSNRVGGARPGAVTGDVDNPYDPTPVPNFHFTTPLKDLDNTWVGISFSAPFGLSNEYDQESFVRYDSIKTSLTTYNIQPSAAYKLSDRLSIGGGVDIQYADAELTQAVDLGAADGVSEFQGSDLSVGWNVGLMYEPAENWRLGAHYRSAISHELNLDFTTFGPGGGIVSSDAGASADLELPDIATLAAAYDIDEQWTVMGHVMWFGWSNFDAITALNSAGGTITSLPQNYKNTYAVALGSEYKHSDEWTFRGGIQFDETPTQDGFRSTRTPDGDRTWVSLGATYNMNPAMDLDFSATFIDVAGEDINVSRAQPSGATANINAEAKQRVGIVALGFNYKF